MPKNLVAYYDAQVEILKDGMRACDSAEHAKSSLASAVLHWKFEYHLCWHCQHLDLSGTYDIPNLRCTTQPFKL